MKGTFAALLAIGFVLWAQTAPAEILFNGMVPAAQDNDPATPDDVIACDGTVLDEVDYLGELHLVVALNYDRNGGAHLKVLINPAGVIAIGRLTGDIYQGVGHTMENNVLLKADGSGIGMYAFQYGLVSHGTGVNYFKRMLIHVVFEENQVPRMVVEHSEITTCR